MPAFFLHVFGKPAFVCYIVQSNSIKSSRMKLVHEGNHASFACSGLWNIHCLPSVELAVLDIQACWLLLYRCDHSTQQKQPKGKDLFWLMSLGLRTPHKKQGDRGRNQDQVNLQTPSPGDLLLLAKPTSGFQSIQMVQLLGNIEDMRPWRTRHEMWHFPCEF